MAIRIPVLPEGTRIRIRRGSVPQEPGVTGRTGVVITATEYRDNAAGVVLDGESTVRYFMPGELEVVEAVPLPPERQGAKQLPALP